METHYDGKRVVVTGGASFIGSHLVDRLLELGAIVSIIDDFSSGLRSNLTSSEVKVIELDLASSPDEVKEVISSEAPNILFHLAAIHGGRGFIETFGSQMLTNLCIDNNVFEASIQSGVGMIVHASSACAYPVGLQDSSEDLGYLTEDQAGFATAGQAYPDGVYGWVKLIGELQLATLASSETRGRSARIFTAYGERENESHAAIALIAKSLMKLDPFPIWGDGNQTRNFTHVSDTVEGLLLLGSDTRSISYDVFNLGSDTHIRVIDFVREVHSQLGWSPSTYDFQCDKPVGVASRAADNKKIIETFGWSPSLTITEGIGRTIDWYRNKPERPRTIEDLDKLLMARG